MHFQRRNLEELNSKKATEERATEERATEERTTEVMVWKSELQCQETDPLFSLEIKLEHHPNHQDGEEESKP